MKSKLTGGRFLLRLLAALAFLAILIVNLAPFVWGLLTSLKPARELMVYPPKFVGFSPSVEHYATVFRRYFFHSDAQQHYLQCCLDCRRHPLCDSSCLCLDPVCI